MKARKYVHISAPLMKVIRTDRDGKTVMDFPGKPVVDVVVQRPGTTYRRYKRTQGMDRRDHRRLERSESRG